MLTARLRHLEESGRRPSKSWERGKPRPVQNGCVLETQPGLWAGRLSVGRTACQAVPGPRCPHAPWALAMEVKPQMPLPRWSLRPSWVLRGPQGGPASSPEMGSPPLPGLPEGCAWGTWTNWHSWGDHPPWVPWPSWDQPRTLTTTGATVPASTRPATQSKSCLADLCVPSAGSGTAQRNG